MTNEWAEFKAYTEQPIYTAEGKRDTRYLGRFTYTTLLDFDGLGRILTILARGYLYHDKDGELLPGSAYDRVNHARNALCAWCSVPDNEKRSDPPVDFRELSADFPELVNDKGKGWFYRHVRAVVEFVNENPKLIDVRAIKNCEAISEGFTRGWKSKVRQLQVPIFALNTKAAWGLRFDDILADAQDAGPLRRREYVLPAEAEAAIQNTDLNGVPVGIVEELFRFYLANRREDTDWVVLPVANFDCFYGNTSFSHKWKSMIPKDIMEISKDMLGVCRYRLSELLSV